MRLIIVFVFSFLIFTPPASAETYAIPDNIPAGVNVAEMKPTKTLTSCGGHPSRNAFVKTPDAMVFTIRHGEKGRCKTDAGKGFTRGRPWAERAEVQSQKFKQGNRYLFSVDISMDPDFKTGHETTVFQVHQWQDKRCRCGPYVMVMFDRRGVLMVKVLKADHSHHQFYTEVTRQEFERRWVEIAVDIDTGKSDPRATIYVGGKQIVDTGLFVQPGGTVFSKTGIYRPGNKYQDSPTDRVYAKNMQYRILPHGTPLQEFQSAD